MVNANANYVKIPTRTCDEVKSPYRWRNAKGDTDELDRCSCPKKFLGGKLISLVVRGPLLCNNVVHSMQ
jgi:hypothetical protein